MCPADRKDDPQREIRIWTKLNETASKHSKTYFDPLQA